MINNGRLETGDTQSFWDAAREGRLVFQRCQNCRHVQHPPRHQCATCWSDALEEITSTGRGRIESITVVRRAPMASFRDKVPYVVVAVIMEEGPRMIANLFGEGRMEAQPDDPVTVEFVPDGAGNVLPQFRLGAAAEV